MITMVGHSPLSMGAMVFIYRDGLPNFGQPTKARSQPKYGFNKDASTGSMLLDSIECDERWTEFVSEWCEGAVSVDLVGIIDPQLGATLSVASVNFEHGEDLALYLSWF